MNIHFLGTGAGMPSKNRNTSALIVNLCAEGEGLWLIDCGEATQHQLLYTSLKPSKITKIFITHLHGDHIFGLPGLISSRSFLGGDDPLTIYGPPGLKAWINQMIAVTNMHISYELHFVEIADHMQIKTPGFTIEVRELQHVIPCYGFRFEQRALPGKLLMEQVQKYAIPKGPLFKQLKEGYDVTLDSGEVIKSIDVTGPLQPGKVITVLGDTSYTQASIELAKEADVLVHEATFDDMTGALATQYGHSTIRQAAQVAKEAGVQALIVNHLSARFLPSDLPRFKKEGQAIFPVLEIAEDLAVFEVKTSGVSRIN